MSTTKQTVSIRQNFSDDCESGINSLINQILYGSYICNSMAYYFDRDDVGLFGVADFYRWCGIQTYHCSRLLMDYIVFRGGKVNFDTIKKPERQEWGSPLESLEYVLDINQYVNKQVLQLNQCACEHKDPHLTDFLEKELLRPMVEFIHKIGVLVSNLRLAGSEIGEYEFNKDLELHLIEIMSNPKLRYVDTTSVQRGLVFEPSEQVDWLPQINSLFSDWKNVDINDVAYQLGKVNLRSGFSRT